VGRPFEGQFEGQFEGVNCTAFAVRLNCLIEELLG
jgi:hypothetical protein